jgi:stage II sporulation protein AA (anti-sigma F factor antagonist)
MLEIDIDSKLGILFVRLFGQLTKNTRKKLNEEVFKLINKVGIKNVVFNVQNLTKIDDSGFKTLIKCYKTCKINKGNSIICLNENQSIIKKLAHYNLVTDELTAVKLINT